MFFSAMYHDFAMSQTESVYVTKGGEVTDLNWKPSLSCEIHSFSSLPPTLVGEMEIPQKVAS